MLQIWIVCFFWTVIVKRGCSEARGVFIDFSIKYYSIHKNKRKCLTTFEDVHESLELLNQK